MAHSNRRKPVRQSPEDKPISDRRHVWEFAIAVVSLIGGVAAAVAGDLPEIMKARADALAITDTSGLIARLQPNPADAIAEGLYFRLAETEVDEASGGAVVGDDLYLVDDEESKLFLFRYVQGNGLYRLASDVRFSDCRAPGAESLRVGNVEDPDDLEGVGVYGNRLYLVTSHGFTEKGRRSADRELFLEIELNGTSPGCVRRAANLRGAVLRALETLKEGASRPIYANWEEGIEIEGLAVDRAGNAYIGLRDPLFRMNGARYALAFRAPVDSLFAEAPSLTPFLLNLGSGGLQYSISSLEYDAQRRELLVLGTTPEKENFSLPPSLWTWRPDPKQTRQWPTLVGDQLLPLPPRARAKAEVVVSPRSRSSVVVFLDSKGYGGQRWIAKDLMSRASRE